MSSTNPCLEKTILDARMGNAEIYCEDMTAWAKSVLEEAETIAI